MYKKAISFLSILLATLMMLYSTTLPVFAYDTSNEESLMYTQASPRFTTISNTVVDFTISGLNSTSKATLMSYYSTNLKIVIELQKEKGSGYETIETWTKTGTGTSLILSESRLINVLSNYRIKVTFTAGSESTYMYKYPA